MSRQIGVGQFGRILNKHMQMIPRAIDGDGPTIQIAKYAADEWMEPFFDVGRDQRLATLGAEHKVVGIPSVRTWHLVGPPGQTE